MERLRDELRRLHDELHRAESVDAESRELLLAIARDIEELVAREPAEAEEPESLAERLREAANHFEESHPSLTAAVGRIANALAAIGI